MSLDDGCVSIWMLTMLVTCFLEQSCFYLKEQEGAQGGDWLTEPAGELHYFSPRHLWPSLTTLRMIIIDIVIIINIIFFISPLSSVFNCTTIFNTKPVDESKKKLKHSYNTVYKKISCWMWQDMVREERFVVSASNLLQPAAWPPSTS